MARYRLRTWLRGHAPEPVASLVPKGRRPCGAHEWYRSSETVDRCYHCRVGERPHVATPLAVGGAEWDGLVDGIEHGSDVSRGALVRRLEETRRSSELGAREALAVLESLPTDDDEAAVDAQRRLRRLAS